MPLLAFLSGQAVSAILLATLFTADLSPSGVSVMTVESVLWIGLLVLVAARGRRPLGPRGATAVLLVAVLAIVVAALSLRRLDLLWLCVVGLMALPPTSLVSLSARSSVLATAGCATTAAALVLSTDVPVGLAWFEAVAVLLLVATPTLLVLDIRRRLVAAQQQAAHAATTDSLTGLLNRRGMAECIGPLVDRVRSGAWLFLVLADLDHFKRVNDTHGHDVGDKVLQAVAGALAATAREGDLVVRLGGEELVWVGLVDGRLAALRLAECARAGIAALDVPGLPAITASLGLALAGPDRLDVGTPDTVQTLLSCLLGEADRALYAAKDAGRDCVVIDQP